MRRNHNFFGIFMIVLILAVMDSPMSDAAKGLKSQDTGELQGLITLCSPPSDATGFLEVDQLIVHTPGENYYLRPNDAGGFTVYFLTAGPHSVNIEDRNGAVLDVLEIEITKNNVASIEVALCPDRDGDGIDQSQDCDDRDSEVNGARDWFEDLDGDGFGSIRLTARACIQPPETSLDSTDCYDMNEDAYPGQQLYFLDERGDGSYDYNCDSNEEGRIANTGECVFNDFLNICVAPAFPWFGTVPECGQEGQQVVGCLAGCTERLVSNTQACR